MLYNNKYRVESARLKNWDYSTDGFYFVTICTNDRKHYLGTIDDGKMALSDWGIIANKFWLEIPVHFANAKLIEQIIMPNHVHGIIHIFGNKNHSRCSDAPGDPMAYCRDAINRVSTTATTAKPETKNDIPAIPPGGITKKYNPMLNPDSLSTIIRWYKGRVAYEINRNNPKHKFKWQPRFHDSILKTNADVIRVRNYIVNNPRNWEHDDFRH